MTTQLVLITPVMGSEPPTGATPKTGESRSFLATITALAPASPPERPHPGLPGGPVDPGWGINVPVDPGYGRPGWSPVDPGFGVGSGLRPDHSLPRPPGYPGGGPITPPMYPSGQPLPPGVPEVPPPTKPVEPGEIWPPLGPGVPVPKLALVWLVGVGYRWVSLGPQGPEAPAQPKA